MAEFLTNALAALIGASAAGAVGFFFAIRKIREERIFDHRFAWLEKTARQLAEAARALQSNATAAQLREHIGKGELDEEEVFARLPNLDSLLIEARMYASNSSIKALREAGRDQANLAVALVQLHEAGERFGHPEFAEKITPRILTAISKSMSHAAARLASDARVTLNLPRLPEEDGLLYRDEVLEFLENSDMEALQRMARVESNRDDL